MKTITTILLLLFLVNTAFASMDLDDKISISKAKETIERLFQVDASEITDESTCEEIDAFLAKNDIRMTGLNEEIITAEQGILCISEVAPSDK